MSMTPHDLTDAVASAKTAATNAVAQKDHALIALQTENTDLRAQLAAKDTHITDIQTALDAAVSDLHTLTAQLNAAFTFT